MSSSFGGTVKLQGENEYRKALKEIQSSLKLVSSELKLTNTEFQNGDKSLKDTKNSYNNMNATIQEQRAKVTELRKVVSEMSKEYGDNNEKVKLFKTQLNNAENQLVQMENATDKSNKELKDMKNNFDDAGQSGLKFGDILKANLLSDAIIGGIKALGSAMKQVGSAVLDLGKKSLESYANYEQLVGGVKTLFGTEATSVEEYAASVGKSVGEVEGKYNSLLSAQKQVFNDANDAYKTAGLSANEYMNTVTSFSASLIASLNGDTEAAAKASNQAIIDMADNANKMGTDMSSIQSAYQRFCKTKLHNVRQSKTWLWWY